MILKFGMIHVYKELIKPYCNKILNANHFFYLYSITVQIGSKPAILLKNKLCQYSSLNLSEQLS